jgi:hypothetical protein
MLCDVLEEAGIPCWVSYRDVPPGQPWAEGIMDGIQASSVLLVLYSRNVQRRPTHIIREIDSALKNQKRLFPILVDETPLEKAFEYYLHVEECVGPFASDEELCSRVKSHLFNSLAIPVAAAARKRDTTGELARNYTRWRETSNELARLARKRTVAALAALSLLALGSIAWFLARRPAPAEYESRTSGTSLQEFFCAVDEGHPFPPAPGWLLRTNLYGTLQWVWIPGLRHPDPGFGWRDFRCSYPHPNEWKILPGYAIQIDGTNHHLAWQPGWRSPDCDYPNVAAGGMEQTWLADPGYVLVSTNPLTPFAKWLPGQKHPARPDLVAGEEPDRWEAATIPLGKSDGKRVQEVATRLAEAALSDMVSPSARKQAEHQLAALEKDVSRLDDSSRQAERLVAAWKEKANEWLGNPRDDDKRTGLALLFGLASCLPEFGLPIIDETQRQGDISSSVRNGSFVCLDGRLGRLINRVQILEPEWK